MSNIVSLNQQKFLKELGALSPNIIYSIAPKEYIVRGFDYYRKSLLLEFKWNKDFSALTAVVAGTWHYAVEFSLNGSNLEYTCDCPAWSRSKNCKHVVCAIITIKNLFHPDSFRNLKQDEKHRKHISECLFNTNGGNAEKEKERQYSVVFAINDHNPDIYVRRDGERVVVSSYRDPEALAPLILPPYYRYAMKLSIVKRYLKEHGNKYPLVLKSDGSEIVVEFDDSPDYACVTEFDAYSSHVKAGRLLKKNGREVSNHLLLEDLVIDMGDKKIGFLEDRSGWGPWNEMYDRDYVYDPFDEELDDDSDDEFDDESDRPYYFDSEDNEAPDQTQGFINIRLQEFEKIRLTYPSSGSAGEMPGHIILKKEGADAPMKKTSRQYRLTVSASKIYDSLFVIKAECRSGRSGLTPSPRLFSFLMTAKYELSGPLRAKKRQASLYRAFFDMLAADTKTEADKAVRDALSGADFSRRQIRNEARGHLQRCLSIFLEQENQLCLEEGDWTVSAVDKRKELLLYKIPYELFGREIFSDAVYHDEMLVPPQRFHESLPLLLEKCDEHGIELFLKNKPVVRSVWDFSFDASRATGIDWFEIRPEINCDGRAVDETLWTEILRGKSMVERDDSIRVMDHNSQKILNVISAMYKTGGIPDTGAKKKDIVRVPRLQILDWIELRRNGVKVKLPPEDERIIERLYNFEKIESRALPKKLKAKLRHYQKEGYYWLSFLHEHRFGACLADDMGLGKTIQAIALLGGIREKIVDSGGKDRMCPHLIVVPPSLLFNWENEIKKFYPALKIYQYTGKDRDTEFKKFDIVLTTYAIVRIDIEKLKDIRFNVVIFDEAQAIKNIYADTTGAVRKLTAYFKLAMTGTPIENHLGEYYSIIDLIIPGLLGEYDAFRPLLKREISEELDIIIRRTRPFVLRRTKEKRLKELPVKLETDIYLELTEKQKALYKKTVEQVRSTIDRAYKSNTAAQAKIIALTAILKLRQLCVSPRLLTDDIKEPSPKIEFLINKLQELQAEDHSALVFSQFTSFLDILEEDLRENGLQYLRLDGSTPTVKRKKLVERFQSEEGPSIFLLSLKAGGQGLNLTRASYVFHLDPWWNPAVENQASDRAHRIGQRKKVTVTRILTHHTIEEKMMSLKAKKLALYRAVLDDAQGGKKTVSVTKADFDFLLG